MVGSLLQNHQKIDRRFTRTQFAQEIRKDPKIKKNTISVTVTYLLISKTNTSESRSELSSIAESTTVQAECQRYMNASVDLYCEFFKTRLLCRETGRFTRRAQNRRSNARRFCSSSLPFLVYFVLFSQVSFSFFQKYKVVPTTFYTCFAPR